MQIQLLKKNDPIIKTLDAAKRNYLMTDLIVKDTYKIVNQEAKTLNEQFDTESKGLDREEVLQKLLDQIEAIENSHNLKGKIELRNLAEKALLETGAEIIKRISPDRWNEISIIFEGKDPSTFSVRQKVINLTLSLDPTR